VVTLSVLHPESGPRDLLVPRSLDQPTTVPLDPHADLAGLDSAKIFAAPPDRAQLPAWRAALRRWREDARARVAHDRSR
jgi:formylglycine-generating enzyme